MKCENLATGRKLGKRMWDMGLLWMAFGIVVGVALKPAQGGAAGAIAGAIAGVVVFLPLGVVLGLLGGNRKESLLGSLAGLGCGGLVGLVSSGDNLGNYAAMGLLFGGLVGATIIGFFYRLPRWLIQIVGS